MVFRFQVRECSGFGNRAQALACASVLNGLKVDLVAGLFVPVPNTEHSMI